MKNDDDIKKILKEFFFNINKINKSLSIQIRYEENSDEIILFNSLKNNEFVIMNDKEFHFENLVYGDSLKKHVLTVGTTGKGKSSLPILFMTNAIKNISYQKHFDEFSIVIVKEKDYADIYLFSSINLTQYQEKFYYDNNVDFNYYKFGYIFNGKSPLDPFFDSINESNYTDYINIQNIIDY